MEKNEQPHTQQQPIVTPGNYCCKSRNGAEVPGRYRALITVSKTQELAGQTARQTLRIDHRVQPEDKDSVVNDNNPPAAEG